MFGLRQKLICGLKYRGSRRDCTSFCSLWSLDWIRKPIANNIQRCVPLLQAIARGTVSWLSTCQIDCWTGSAASCRTAHCISCSFVSTYAPAAADAVTHRPLTPIRSTALWWPVRHGSRHHMPIARSATRVELFRHGENVWYCSKKKRSSG